MATFLASMSPSFFICEMGKNPYLTKYFEGQMR